MTTAPAPDRTALDAHDRTLWPDVAKGVGIILVVLGHSLGGLMGAGILSRAGSAQWVYDWIYTFHMPAFFLLSGLFIARSMRRGLGGFVLERLKTIYYPGVLWGYLGFAPEVIVTLINSVRPGTLAPGLLGTSNPLSSWLTLAFNPDVGLWFMTMLFVLSVLLGVLLSLGLSARMIALGFLGVLAALLVCWPGPDALAGPGAASTLAGTLWGLFNKLVWYGLWLCAGCALAEPLMSLARRTPTWSLALIAASAGALLTTLVPLPEIAHPGGQGELAAHLVVRSRLATPVGVLMMLSACVLASRTILAAPLGYVGRRSLEIYCVHGFGHPTMRSVLRLAHVASPAVYLTLVPLAGLALPLVLERLLARLRIGYVFRWGPAQPRA